jgi:hypothetical protein
MISTPDRTNRVRHQHLSSPLSTSMAVDPDTMERNLETARQKKATGDTAFKAGDLPNGR